MGLKVMILDETDRLQVQVSPLPLEGCHLVGEGVALGRLRNSCRGWNGRPTSPGGLPEESREAGAAWGRMGTSA